MEAFPEWGRLVKVLRGKDQGGCAVIIGIVDDRFVLIADGNKHRFDGPKKKSLLHLELLPVVSSEVADSMRETGRVTNAKLRFAIQKYNERKGE
ncbi:KOW domain-containing protein [Paenibacillus darwinianus]|uniref:KOW domain-containing protein n=1 Tax=Paenibacillus darwinianus TaxID=1380763 RepID=A0A9W5S2J0_9BACL|nr:KOW domain-containing RNA-binding protein [Paenibacillus darwinianus]EXX88978.1 KOW domain-containing protein [Paenibacillus darwinianus]EXX89623.1 KOW domain-containing protein [Paenibacillus darwinianus]EXX90291.1 KOW domain-containing protein [Paenibacillus darwinianus]